MRTKPTYLHAPGVGKNAGKRTQEAVAKALGISPQRVGQLERSAFKKIRRFLEKA